MFLCCYALDLGPSYTYQVSKLLINAGHIDAQNYACIIICFRHYMVSTDGYMFPHCLHRIIHYVHSTNRYMY